MKRFLVSGLLVLLFASMLLISPSVGAVHKNVAVQFVKTGLPKGTTWSVTLDSRTKSSSDNTIAFGSIDIGPHSFTIPSVDGYVPDPSSGTITVTGEDNPVRIYITFTLPLQITVPSYQTQFIWRSWYEAYNFGDWLYQVIPNPDYPSLTSTDYILTGNELQTAIPSSYPGLPGTLDYIYDSKTNLWILQVNPIVIDFVHNYPYYGYYVTVYLGGYIEFSGKPSASTFEHGVLYYWCYVNAPQTDPGPSDIWGLPKWDGTVGGWLQEFSYYFNDNTQVTYPWLVPLPIPVPGPSSYNPLGL
jgi:hypothetical protein